MRRLLLLIVMLAGLATPAQAHVTITFYSHDLRVGIFNTLFPHGFFTLNGTTGDGRPVKAN